MTNDILIIGAGITGLSAALYLKRNNLRVILLDKVNVGSKKQTSYGNAGLLAASSIIPLSSPGLIQKLPNYMFSKSSPVFFKYSYLLKLMPWLIPFLKNSNNEKFLSIIKNIHELTYDTVEQHVNLTKNTKASKFIKKGKITMIFENKNENEQNSRDLEIRKNYGFNFKKICNSKFLKDYYYLSNNYDSGTEFKNHGWISSPQNYLKALKTEFLSIGGKFINDEVKNIEKNFVTTMSNRVFKAEKIIISSGIWSKRLLKNLNHKVNIEAERGYHIVLKGVNFLPPNPLMIINKKIAITPMENTLRFAGIVEFAGIDEPEIKSRYNFIRQLIKKIMPDLKWKSEDLWMGQRPSSSDSLPIIGKSDKIKDVFFAFGGQHVGMTMGPKVGKIISDLILNKKNNIDLSPYSQNRFL